MNWVLLVTIVNTHWVFDGNESRSHQTMSTELYRFNTEIGCRSARQAFRSDATSVQGVQVIADCIEDPVDD